MRILTNFLFFVYGLSMAEATCSDDTSTITLTTTYNGDGTFRFALDHSSFITFGTKYCAIVVTTWSGSTPGTHVYSASLCTAFDAAAVTFSPATTGLNAFAVDSAYAFAFREYTDSGTFSAGAGTASCSSTTSVTPPQCPGGETISWIDSGYGEITVAPTVYAGTNNKCKYVLEEWGGTPNSYQIARISEDCSPVTFLDHDVVGTFNYTGDYQFSYQKFAYGASIDNDTPICGVMPAAAALYDPTCDASRLVFARPDGNSIVVTVNPTYARAYMLCRITMKELHLDSGPAADIVRVGSCTDDFEFIAGAPDSFDTTAGDTLHFTLEQFPSGDINEISSDCSLPVSPQAYTIVAYPLVTSLCDQVLDVTRLPGAIYSFKIADPHPLSGSCTISISADAGAVTGAYQLADCADAVTMDLYDIRTNLVQSGTLAAGDAMTFTWALSNAGTCTSASTTPPINVDAPVPITALYSAGTIIVTIGTVTDTTLTSGSTYECGVTLLSCDGTSIVGTTTTPSTTCTGTTMSPITVPGSPENCIVQVTYFNSGALSTILTYSDPISVAVATVPSWTVSPSPGVSPYGQGCLLVTWTAPDNSGGSPVLCYIVLRKDGTGPYYEIGDSCDPNNPNASFLTATSFVACTFTTGTAYYFQVEAVNRIGVSAAIDSSPIQTEYLLAAPASVYTSSTLSLTTFAAGSFPMITVQEENPISSPIADATPTDRLFVGRLLNLGAMDSTGVVFTPTYPNALSIPVNSPPAFTKVYISAVSAGFYNLIVTEAPPAGSYSLATYSLESGGLLGQYWANPFLASTPDLTQKDPIINFAWGLGPIINTGSITVYDLVSMRWTGFVEADFTEEYTFFLTTNDNVRMWVDDVIIINQWGSSYCVVECSGQAELQQSVPGLGSRKFHYVRIEYAHSKGPTQSKAAALTLSWASFSQPRQIIPTMQMFEGLVIAPSHVLLPITIVPNVLDSLSSIVTMPVGPFYAGNEYLITIQARDQFGNDLTDFSSSFVADFSVAATASASSSPAVPTLVPPNGLYVIPFVLTAIGMYNVNIYGSDSGTMPTETLTVLPQGGYSANSITIVTTSPSVDSPVIISVHVKDINGNSLGSADPVPDLYINAEWTGDSVTETRLSPYDDYELRRERFGDYFTQSSVVWSSGTYHVSINLPRAGNYDCEVGIVGGATPVPLTIDSVLASPSLAAPQYTVLVYTSTPFTSLVAGTPAIFVIQLRDQYMNALGADPSTTPSHVTIQLDLYSGVGETATCTPTTPLPGQYTCTITPTKAGVDRYLSILVNNVNAAYIAEIGGEVRHFPGPWLVSVVAGAVTSCKVTGLRPIYIAGVAVDATLVFYDVNGNVITDPGSPVIVAQFSSDTAISSGTFISNVDGSVTIPVVAASSHVSTTLTISVASTDCAPTPLTVTVLPGTVVSSQAVCTNWSITEIAGATDTLQCTPYDKGGNSLTRDYLYTYGDCQLSSDTSANVVSTDTFLSSVYSYPMILTTAGEYSCYFLMGQPGGLMAQYYSEDDFTEIIGVDNTPLVDPRHLNEPPVTYTQIDSFLDFDWGGPIVINGITVQSVTWTGFIVPSASGQMYKISVTANGGVQLTMPSGLGTSFDQLTASTVNYATTTAFALTQYVAYPIEIQYIPQGSAAISLQWEYTTGSPSPAGNWVIPASVLQTPLSVLTVANTVTVSPSTISTNSVAHLPPFFLQGQSETFTIQAIDTYGNLLIANVGACLYGSSPPGCLFRFTLSPYDGTSFTVAGNGDGTNTVTATFLTDGPRQLTIELVTSGPAYTAIAGSPYSFDVNPTS